MRLFFYIGGLFLLISCDAIGTSDPLDKEQLRQEIRQMLHNYHRDIAGEGLTAEFKYLDPSENFFWAPPGYGTAISYDSVRRILEQNAPTVKLALFSWDTLKVFPLSKKIASFTGIVTGKIVDTQDVESVVRMIESGTLIKRNDGWKLLSGQTALLETTSDGENDP